MQDIQQQIEYLTRGNIEILPTPDTLTEQLKKDTPLRVKLGIDPTAPDLHLGHTVCLQLLKRFQDLGHIPVLLIGGFTAQLGDPTGRNETRPPLSPQDVQANAETYLNQASKILDLDKTEIVNNNDWLTPLNLTDILKLLGHTTVNQIIAKDAFGKRLDDGHPLYMHEIIYPILQGYDSVHIKADIELGGQDQRFNVLMGRHLQKQFGQSSQTVMLTPLLVGTDGSKKMSKSFGNSIGINDEPNDMFGKVMSIPDTLIVDWYSLLTNTSQTKISTIKTSLQSKSVNPRDLKIELAQQLIAIYHSDDAAQSATQNFITKFQKKEIPDDIPSIEINPNEFPSIAHLLHHIEFTPSLSEAKRKIKEGAIKINSEKISIDFTPNNINNNDVIQLGKRQFARLILDT